VSHCLSCALSAAELKCACRSSSVATVCPCPCHRLTESIQPTSLKRSMLFVQGKCDLYEWPCCLTAEQKKTKVKKFVSATNKHQEKNGMFLRSNKNPHEGGEGGGGPGLCSWRALRLVPYSRTTNLFSVTSIQL
jgi:hypothetical protein